MNSSQAPNPSMRPNSQSSGSSQGGSLFGNHQTLANLPGVFYREIEIVPLLHHEVVWERCLMDVVSPLGQQVILQQVRTDPPLACGTPLGHWSEIRECHYSHEVVHLSSLQRCGKCGQMVWSKYTSPRTDVFGQELPVCFSCLLVVDRPCWLDYAMGWLWRKVRGK